MKLAPSCTAWTLHVEGVAYAMIPYGQETRYGPDYVAEWRCHDCFALPGGFHHPGCDWAECPKCHQQLLGCDCVFDEDEDEDDG